MITYVVLFVGVYKHKKILDITESQALFNFYELALIDINNYSNLSESSDNYNTVHESFKIMKAELKF